MRLNLPYFSFPLRACLNCGSWLNLRTFFCRECHDQCLRQFNSESEFLVQSMKVLSVLLWPPGVSNVLSGLVLQLKTENVAAWGVWADEFAKKFLEIPLPQDAVFVTSRSSSGNRHAQNWAAALSSRLGIPIVHELKLKSGSKKQRELRIAERTLREFESPVETSALLGKRVIFIDDVVTTGQTALSAYLALGKPDEFEVWCFIYREL